MESLRQVTLLRHRVLVLTRRRQKLCLAFERTQLAGVNIVELAPIPTKDIIPKVLLKEEALKSSKEVVT